MEKPANIDAYIAQFPPEVQERLQQLRRIIQKAAPEATEKISYGMPTFYLDGNLVHFAAWQAHIGLYPAPQAIAALKNELAAYTISKGSVHLPFDKALPANLIKKIVHFRMAENKQKKDLKKARVK